MERSKIAPEIILVNGKFSEACSRGLKFQHFNINNGRDFRIAVERQVLKSECFFAMRKSTKQNYASFSTVKYSGQQ